jgi:hypothetical protein
MNFRIVKLVVLVGMLSTTACANDRVITTYEPDSTPEDESLETEVPPTIDVCEDTIVLGVAFPRQEPVEGLREVMEAELIGDLVLVDGCLRVDSLYNDDAYLPIWPPDFTLVLENEFSVVLDGDGNLVGRVGEEIYMGGGMGSERALVECQRQQMPDACGGPYWVVGEGVRLNLQYDSELFDMELISSPDRTAILLHKQPVLDEWTEEPGVISGVLRFYQPSRCPRVQSESGVSDYLPIWPPGNSLQWTDGLVEIVNSSGDLIAREGESVTLSGSRIPPTWENEHYRQLYYELPGDCNGPYWIVGE